MTTVRVKASREYDVIIGRGLLGEAGALIAPLFKGKRLALVTDSNVAPLYAEPVTAALDSAGFTVYRFTFPAGETSKCMRTYAELLDFLAENRLSRTDGIVALGGGVVGDLAGFAAATYLRGVGFVQIPTTLLAAVDSSVGGKTGIDLPTGKNLCGAFYQPRLVICDTDTLISLDRETFACGAAEVIKYGVIRDGELFSLLEEASESFMSIPSSPAVSDEAMLIAERIIASCVDIKRSVVEEDETESGIRACLNFGHTAAHSIEKLSRYTVPHGTAVAAGMGIAASYAERRGGFDASSRARLISLLRSYGLPSDCDECIARFGLSSDELSPDRLADAARSDKKADGGEIRLVLPTRIGGCELVMTPTDRLTDFMTGGEGLLHGC